MIQIPNLKNMVVTHQAKNEEVENLFRAMQRNDLAEAVLGHKMTAQFYEMLRPMQLNHNIKKSEELSNIFRSEGNTQYRARNLQHALIFYNKALMYAPEDSLAMLSAYSNRSAIFLEGQLATASLNDIEKCLGMSCPDGIKTKLLKRKKQALNMAQVQTYLKNFNKKAKNIDEFFNFDVERNRDIPCAIKDLEVITKDNMPKVVAKNDIKVGTIIAIETAFVNVPHAVDRFYCCHYCNKLSLNLIPCPGCSYALFCNEECRERSWTDYHNIECLVINTIYPTNSEARIDLAFKATLKIKNKTKSWKEFIEASYNMGQERISQSSINEIFDSKNPFSLLTFSEKQHFVYGKMYNSGALCAYIIKNLKEIVPSYFPQSTEERNAAIRAFARIFLYLAVYGNKVSLATCISNELSQTTFIDENHFGLFSFCSKLKMSCHANALTVSLNKDVALIAMQPIPAGTELTIPFMENWHLSDEIEKRNKVIYQVYDTLCDCKHCIDKKYQYSFEAQLNVVQIETLKRLNIERMSINFNRDTVLAIYKKLCDKMHIFSDIPYTENNIVYSLFRKCILHMQDIVAGNIVIGVE